MSNMWISGVLFGTSIFHFSNSEFIWGIVGFTLSLANFYTAIYLTRK